MMFCMRASSTHSDPAKQRHCDLPCQLITPKLINFDRTDVDTSRPPTRASTTCTTSSPPRISSRGWAVLRMLSVSSNPRGEAWCSSGDCWGSPEALSPVLRFSRPKPPDPSPSLDATCEPHQVSGWHGVLGQ